jgi:hypothetical protein
MRDHSPIVIDKFNGMWKRGDADSCPQDHFTDCNNIAFYEGGFKWRDGLDLYKAIPDVVRMYTYTKQTGQSLIILDSNGQFWDSDFTSSPILTVSGATDFGFVSYAGRAYITPCDGETGLQSEFVYVYLGNGTSARKAAGSKPTDTDGALAAANSGSAGNVEAGIHIFAVIYETNTGFLTAIGPDTLPALTAPGSESVNLSSIPVSPNSYVVKRHIVATKAINPTFYIGDTRGYQFFFVPNGEINNNTATTLTVSFFDSELLEDASYLLDILEEIPAGAGLSVYHNRMTQYAEYDNESLIRVSNAGEPESFNAVDGLVVFPLDGKPITSVQEFRDVMYGFKNTKTNAWTDNGDAPSSWPLTILDQGIGCGLHGIAKALDSEGVNVDFLIVASYTGVYLFNGAYQTPELTWKIKDYWNTIAKLDYSFMHCLNDTIDKILYFALPDGTVLIGDYSNTLDYENIKWSPWTFKINVSCLALIDGNTLIVASSGPFA